LDGALLLGKLKTRRPLGPERRQPSDACAMAAVAARFLIRRLDMDEDLNRLTREQLLDEQLPDAPRTTGELDK